ncbi:MAG TPA: FHA domain-containing protein [Candidatus Eremiobacteraceae bacterium]|nr:FHA domain-containing protein [Candidatus Eremiobacteraceae bacterium]
MYELEAMNGPLDGKRWAFSRDISIGRDGTTGAELSTDRAASRRHAEVRVTPEGLRLADLDSRNGTLVDGSPIESPVIISVGQPFIVGRTMLRVVDQTSAEKA